MIKLVDYLLSDDYSNKVAEHSIVTVLEMRKSASNYKYYLYYMSNTGRYEIITGSMIPDGYTVFKYIRKHRNAILNKLVTI